MRFVLFFLLICSKTFAFDINEVERLQTLLLSEDKNQNHQFFHYVKEVGDGEITLNDGSVWKMGWWYTDVIKSWLKHDRLKIYYNGTGSADIKFENVEIGSLAWGSMKKLPETKELIAKVGSSKLDPEAMTDLVLQNGLVFQLISTSWKAREEVFIFNGENGIDLFNFNRNEILRNLQTNEGKLSLFDLEKKLTKRVLGQKEAIQSVKAPIFVYWAGLNEPKAPIATFLFLGPTGVGKTELAKALTDELFNSQSYMIRFDMSHFADAHTINRLVGSPPGYVNHEEGGQLTEALKAKPKSLVLLDEMEKANPVVRKFFLPVFDEGFIHDAKNQKINCNDVIFVMTSNICALEIAELFNKGCTADEVLKIIEPLVIEALSPELYNRVIPVVFRPLTQESMSALVDLFLKDIIEKMKRVKGSELIITPSARKYLIFNGFHPILGARPLKRLIQKEVVATLSYGIVDEGIPDGAQITLNYSHDKKSWEINWN